MKVLIQLVVTAIFVVTLATVLPGVSVDSFMTSLVVAALLALLNIFVKPILVIFTLPVTVLTFGIFLLVINAAIILMCDALVDGFRVNGFWWALLFSVLLSLIQSLVRSGADKVDRQPPR
ncbi:MAG: phage holin family protein [Flavobacteriaceae bacterium]|nr:phage holin family protein [Flavobacteriaceae bacterium]